MRNLPLLLLLSAATLASCIKPTQPPAELLPLPATAPATSAATAPAATMKAIPMTRIEAGAWSKPNGGLRARLLVTIPDVNRDILVSIEVETIISDGVSISTHPQLSWHLTDAQAKDVPEGINVRGGGGSGGVYPEGWVNVLPEMRVSLIARPPGGVFGTAGTRTLALQSKEWKMLGEVASVWALTPGEYTLSGNMACKKKDNGPANQWIGQLNLPPVRLRLPGPHGGGT